MMHGTHNVKLEYINFTTNYWYDVFISILQNSYVFRAHIVTFFRELADICKIFVY